MGTLNRGFRTGLMASIAAAVGGMFKSTPKHLKPQYGGTAKRYRFARTTQNPAGSKIRRAIRRGNFGLVNKHGVISAAIAENARVKWLKDKGYPVIKLSTQKF